MLSTCLRGNWATLLLPIAADNTRQTINRQTTRLSEPGVVQSRHVDLELQQLYGEIMRRVDMSYKDAR